MFGVLPPQFYSESGPNKSGEEKAHRHKQFCSVIVWVGGGLPTGGQGSNVYVLCAEPKEN